MAPPYRIFGAELSPYSVKVRSYFRYKGIPHEWTVRGPDNQAEFQKYAKLPLMPLVVTPEDQGLQDSTPILEAMEARFPEPGIYPSDPSLAFVSALLEEFGDEWGNKWMFHYRWAREADQNSAAERLARVMAPGLEGDQLAGAIAGVKQRMVGRVWFVGSNEETAPQIEESYQEAARELTTVQGQLESLTRDLADAHQELAERDQIIAKHKKKVTDNKETIDSLKTVINNFSRSVDGYLQDRDDQDQTISSLKDVIADMYRSIDGREKN